MAWFSCWLSQCLPISHQEYTIKWISFGIYKKLVRTTVKDFLPIWVNILKSQETKIYPTFYSKKRWISHQSSIEESLFGVADTLTL